ncbi:MAG: hypothetical protein ACKO96_07095, partial [Flammeovirgaceae bacterium]
MGAFELVRHGARTPLIKESHSELYFGTQRSQLTINGFRQHFLLGKWIKKRYMSNKYNSFLTEESIAQDIK